jgi:hypothetical protein
VVVMTIPPNVSRFEILMYLSLLVIVVSGILFVSGEFADTAAGTAWFAGAVLLMIVTWSFIIRLAARKRMNWARWFLLILQGCGVASLLTRLIEPAGGIVLDLAASAFGSVGLYFAFTVDAKAWFKPARIG